MLAGYIVQCVCMCAEYGLMCSQLTACTTTPTGCVNACRHYRVMRAELRTRVFATPFRRAPVLISLIAPVCATYCWHLCPVHSPAWLATHVHAHAHRCMRLMQLGASSSCASQSCCMPWLHCKLAKAVLPTIKTTHKVHPLRKLSDGRRCA